MMIVGFSFSFVMAAMAVAYVLGLLTAVLVARKWRKRNEPN